MTSPDLLIDHFLPHPHFEVVRTTIVDAPVKETYAAARELDFTDVRGGVVSAAGWLRMLPERWHHRRHGPPRRPTRLTPDDLDAGSEWALLGDRPGGEFALGVAGKFWQPVITWRRVEADDFAAFDEAGYGKLVLAVSVFPYGPHRTLLTAHTRVRMSDPESWLKFRRSWRLSRPAIGSVHTALVRTVAANARQRALAAYTRTVQP
ncbi:hypothetical protein Amsp01_042330 [Amycolatopsis sp. NBRC 101858]|uniref:hypothetical protein n=1 Tax=Amycolatopsis sp. NBRC 101858 TaxID=3032200 RepID=UPI0024A381C8|nr:hypothetical protein [Amycolatopsis sp. NBRC 101858]GLY38209.1 hypothetical protein Amsp01_042330 [Amycolatopsis sp. NBRC 101858]